MLGPLEAESNTGPVDLGPRMQRVALLSLLLAPGRERTAAQLVADIWDDRPPGDPYASLYPYLSNLRRLLEPGRPSGSAPTVLTRTQERYRLCIDPGAVDLDCFESEWKAVTQEARHPAERVDLAERALARWRGRPFGDADDCTFVHGERLRVESMRRDVEELRIRALIDLDQSAEAATSAATLAERDPLDERLRGLHMLALYRSGRQAEALRVYGDTRRMLVDQLGIEPGHELRQLEGRILRQDPELLDPSSGRGGAAPPAARRPSRRGVIAGRARELEVCTEAVSESRHGFVRTVLIRGEAGVGKTCLVEEIVDAADQVGDRVLWISCEADHVHAGLWTVGVVLRDALEDMVDGSSHDAGVSVAEFEQRFALGGDQAVDHGAPRSVEDGGAALRAMFEMAFRVLQQLAQRRPLVVVIEDLHQANDVTARFVEFVAGRRDRGGVCVIVTTRLGDPAGDSARIGSLLRSPGTSLIELGGLSRSAVATLAGERFHDADREISDELHRRTDGNALFVTEWLRALDPEAPATTLLEGSPPTSLVDLVVSRLSRLPSEAAEWLTVAALCGSEFDARVCAEAAGVDEGLLAAIDAAIAAEFIVDRSDVGTTYAFRHELVRDAVASIPSSLKRAHLHARLGTALRARHGDAPESAAEISSHLCRGAHAGTAVDGASAARLAARTALERHDALSAIELALAGLEALTAVPPAPDRFALEAALWCELAEARTRALQWVDAQQSAINGFDIALRAGLVDLMAEATLVYSRRSVIAPWLGYWSDARQMATMAGQTLDRLDDDHTKRVALLGVLSEASLDLGDAERSDDLTLEAVRCARNSTRRGDLLEGLLRRHLFADLHGSERERRDLLDEVVANSEGHAAYEAYARRALAVLELEAGHRRQARSHVEAIRVLGDRTDDDRIRYQAEALHIAIGLLLSDIDDAPRLIAAAQDRFQHLSEASQVFQAQMFFALSEQHELGASEDELRALLDETRSPAWRAPLIIALSERGSVEAARRWMNGITRSHVERITETRVQLVTPYLWAHLFANLGDRERAEWLLPLLGNHRDRIASGYNGQFLCGWVTTQFGRLLSLCGHRDEAETMLLDGQHRARSLGASRFEMRALTALVEHDLRSGDTARVDPTIIEREATTHGWVDVAVWARRLANSD